MTAPAIFLDTVGLLALWDRSDQWHRAAEQAFRGPGVVDLISFQAMRHLGIERVFTNDRHFREAGFQVLF